VGLTDRFRTVADKRGLYAPNASVSRLSESAMKSGPRLVAVNGRR
jgi:hypothetical protein